MAFVHERSKMECKRTRWHRKKQIPCVGSVLLSFERKIPSDAERTLSRSFVLERSLSCADPLARETLEQVGRDTNRRSESCVDARRKDVFHVSAWLSCFAFKRSRQVGNRSYLSFVPLPKETVKEDSKQPFLPETRNERNAFAPRFRLRFEADASERSNREKFVLCASARVRIRLAFFAIRSSRGGRTIRHSRSLAEVHALLFSSVRATFATLLFQSETFPFGLIPTRGAIRAHATKRHLRPSAEARNTHSSSCSF